MAKSLNHYANRVAHIVGQPNNASLKERIKDSIKDYFAKYIIQSIDRNGIHDFYKITLELEVSRSDNHIETDINKIYYNEYISSKIPKPLNLKNDAPFTRISIKDTNKLFTYVSKVVYRMSSTLSPTRGSYVYTYDNDILSLKRISPAIKGNANLFNGEKGIIEVEGLWENPEEVIGYYSIGDNQNIDLPFPNEMINFVIADLLKTEFNIVPKETEIEKH